MMTLEEFVGKRLKKLCPIDLQLAWHENKSSFLSCKKERGCIHLRLHRLFSTAPSPVLEALCSYAVKGDLKSGVIVRQMAHLYFSNAQAAPDPLVPKGRAYDLKAISQRINERYFSSDLKVSIGWSNRCRIGKFRCITFGSYDRHRNQIRIHPLLDNVAVPLYFVEFIVYHEMLHAVCPSQIDARGSVRCHTPEFRRLERKFEQFAAAKEWEKNSLKFLKSGSLNNKRMHGRS